jgi:hypothetical protein
MRTPYTHITVEAIPQPIENILDDNDPINKAIAQETKLAYSAPDLKLALEDIGRVERTKEGAVVMARLAQQALQKLSGA